MDQEFVIVKGVKFNVKENTINLRDQGLKSLFEIDTDQESLLDGIEVNGWTIHVDGTDSIRLPSIEGFLGPTVSSGEPSLTNPIPIFSWPSIILLFALLISSWVVLKQKRQSILP